MSTSWHREEAARRKPLDLEPYAPPKYIITTTSPSTPGKRRLAAEMQAFLDEAKTREDRMTDESERGQDMADTPEAFISTPEGVKRGDWGPDPAADAEERKIEVERIARQLYIDGHTTDAAKEDAALWWDRLSRDESTASRYDIMTPYYVKAEQTLMRGIDKLTHEVEGDAPEDQDEAPVANPGMPTSVHLDEVELHDLGDGSADYQERQIRDRQDEVSKAILGLDDLNSKDAWALSAAVPDGDELGKTQSTDANLWAFAFNRQFGGHFFKHPCHPGGIERLDDTRAWFANAIQGAIDRTRNEIEEQPDRFLAEQAIRDEYNQVVSHLQDRCQQHARIANKRAGEYVELQQLLKDEREKHDIAIRNQDRAYKDREAATRRRHDRTMAATHEFTQRELQDVKDTLVKQGAQDLEDAKIDADRRVLDAKREAQEQIEAYRQQKDAVHKEKTDALNVTVQTYKDAYNERNQEIVALHRQHEVELAKIVSAYEDKLALEKLSGESPIPHAQRTVADLHREVSSAALELARRAHTNERQA